MPLALLLLAFATATSAEATDPTIDEDPDGRQDWYSAPNYRGTLDILWPCLLTVFVCCWTVVHPNIPHPNSKWYQRWLDRIIAFRTGIIASEVIVYIAHEEVRYTQTSISIARETMGTGKWSHAHTMYARMGGFLCETIELAAWNVSFDTTFELMAWRECSLVIMLFVPAFYAVNLTLRLVGVMCIGLSEERYDAVKSYFFNISFVVDMVARLYLIVECFAGLRAAPKGVYRTPEWSKFIPHFG